MSCLASLLWKKPKAKIAGSQRWQIPSSSSTNCTDVITPPSSACLSLHPLTSRNCGPEMFLGTEKTYSRVLPLPDACSYLPVCVLHICASGFEWVCESTKKHILQQTNGNEIFQECLLNQVILGNLTAKVTNDFWFLFAQCGAGAGLCPGKAPWLRGVSGPQHPEEKLCVLTSVSKSRNSFRTWLEPRAPTSTLPGERLSPESWRDLPGHAPTPAFTKRKEAGKKKKKPAPRDVAP